MGEGASIRGENPLCTIAATRQVPRVFGFWRTSFHLPQIAP